MVTISCSRAVMVPHECQRIGARSGTTSRFLLRGGGGAYYRGGQCVSVRVYLAVLKGRR
jgi:hypothetical protein